MIQIKYLTMNCSKCLKEKDKLWWFNSDHSVCDGYFYCKECFKKLFKIQTGMTVMKYVTKLRMEKAQALLTHTDYPLPIIGEKVGYKEPSAFSRKFSQYFGLSPTKFKK